MTTSKIQGRIRQMDLDYRSLQVQKKEDPVGTRVELTFDEDFTRSLKFLFRSNQLCEFEIAPDDHIVEVHALQ